MTIIPSLPVKDVQEDRTGAVHVDGEHMDWLLARLHANEWHLKVQVRHREGAEFLLVDVGPACLLLCPYDNLPDSKYKCTLRNRSDGEMDKLWAMIEAICQHAGHPNWAEED